MEVTKPADHPDRGTVDGWSASCQPPSLALRRRYSYLTHPAGVPGQPAPDLATMVLLVDSRPCLRRSAPFFGNTAVLVTFLDVPGLALLLVPVD
jgi:hypothetical protein